MPHSIQEILDKFHENYKDSSLFECFDGAEKSLIKVITQTYTQARASALQEAVEVVEKTKVKWSRPNLDTVVGEKTAEIVGGVGEHIAEEIIERLQTLKQKE